MERKNMDYILTEVADGVATITLNNPEKRNAISLKMNDEICETMDALESSATITDNRSLYY